MLMTSAALRSGEVSTRGSRGRWCRFAGEQQMNPERTRRVSANSALKAENQESSVTCRVTEFSGRSGHLPPFLPACGAVAQLGERLNGIQEVEGSTPFGSTFPSHHLADSRLDSAHLSS